MFEFLKKKPAAPTPDKPVAVPPDGAPDAGSSSSPVASQVPPAPRGFSPDDLVRAYTDVQAEKAARLEAEKAAARVAVKQTLGGSLLARSLGGLFSGNPKLDEDLLEHIETALISADVGVTATGDLVAATEVSAPSVASLPRISPRAARP